MGCPPIGRAGCPMTGVGGSRRKGSSLRIEERQGTERKMPWMMGFHFLIGSGNVRETKTPSTTYGGPPPPNGGGFCNRLPQRERSRPGGGQGRTRETSIRRAGKPFSLPLWGRCPRSGRKGSSLRIEGRQGTERKMPWMSGFHFLIGSVNVRETKTPSTANEVPCHVMGHPARLDGGHPMTSPDGGGFRLGDCWRGEVMMQSKKGTKTPLRTRSTKASHFGGGGGGSRRKGSS